MCIRDSANETNVSEVLWSAMERNDFSRWPNGIFARAYIRDYAKIIGADPDTTVDEFCRWFPQGDRRADRQIREQAEILNHKLDVKAEIPPDVGEDRRWSPEKAMPQSGSDQGDADRGPRMFDRLRRVLSRA